MQTEPGASGPARVLVIEDDPRSAMMIVETLRAAWPHGLLITHAPRVDDALAELADHDDSCVVLELCGGDCDPLRRLRELTAAAPAAAIVAISHDETDGLGLAAVRGGAQDHLPRSELNPATLSRAVGYAVERKRVEVRLTHQALQDPLTGLPNRALFADRLSVALDRSRRTGLAPAVMFLDIDAFKAVNDSFGHAAGDRLLRELADRFRALLRPMDTVARLGGDEFTFLFEGLSGRDEALAIAGRIGEAARAPVDIGGDGGPTRTAVSIGIAMLEDPGVEFEAAIRDADSAMYRAKRLGGARAELFTEDVPARGGAAGRRGALVAVPPAPSGPDDSALRAALAADQLRVHYQPRVSINGQTGLVGFEALVRWDHPVRGLIAPAEFVPLAEATGLIDELGDWVIEQALGQVHRWRQTRPGMAMSVNLSPGQLRDPALADRIGAILQRTGADPGTLWLEIAEEAVLGGPSGAADADGTAAPAGEALARLRALGVKIAIDDFGIGRSSLGSLRDLPVDMLKIHESFVSTLGRGADDGAVVGAVVELGHALGLSVIAEGVETDHQLAELRDLGCDGAQGFLFSRPVDGDSVGELLRSA